MEHISSSTDPSLRRNLKLGSSRSTMNQRDTKTNHDIERLNQDAKDEKWFDTQALDSAMKELLDFCEQYNDKVERDKNSSSDTDQTNHSNTQQQANSINHDSIKNNTCDKPKGSNLNQSISKNNEAQVMVDSVSTIHKKSKSLACSVDTIEGLREKQGELQLELDELLRQVEDLKSRNKSKLDVILGDDLESSQQQEEDDELIEFQQIENELRISELNRQLNIIQEKLRLKLYKQLISNSTNMVTKSTIVDANESSNFQSQVIRRGSAQTDEFTPPSSAFSEELTASSNSNFDLQSTSNDVTPVQTLANFEDGINAHPKGSDNSFKLNNTGPPDTAKCQISSRTNLRQDTQKVSGPGGVCNVNSNFMIMNRESSSHILNKELPCSAKLTSIIETNDTLNDDLDSYNINTNSLTFQPSNCSNLYNISHIGFRKDINSDLECINEDEEDCQDTNYQSDHMRTIYETKISPLLFGPAGTNQTYANSHSPVFQPSQTSGLKDDKQEENSTMLNNVEVEPSIGPNGFINVEQWESKFPAHASQENCVSYQEACSSSSLNVSTSSYKQILKNRPLTLYLPKPDEEIDLADHIQSLGHHLESLSNGLKITSTSAAGYLRKNCSSNPKKFLERYFYFDRKSKCLSYYNNETDLVKKGHNSSKRNIPFSEISDVYVDHKLNVQSEKGKSDKKKNYVFILLTNNRKYMLATSKVELMRAWIDIMFTAAKADCYLEQLSDLDDGDDSFVTANTSN